MEIISTATFRRVSERNKFSMMSLEPFPAFNSRSVKNYHLKSSHQTSHISLCVIFGWSPVVYFAM